MPFGWLAWALDCTFDKLHYAEYNNSKPNTKIDMRVNWTSYHPINAIKASTISKFIGCNSWIVAVNVQYDGGLLP